MIRQKYTLYDEGVKASALRRCQRRSASSLPLLVPSSSEHPHVFRMLFVVCAFPPSPPLLALPLLALPAHTCARTWAGRGGPGAEGDGGSVGSRLAGGDVACV